MRRSIEATGDGTREKPYRVPYDGIEEPTPGNGPEERTVPYLSRTAALKKAAEWLVCDAKTARENGWREGSEERLRLAAILREPEPTPGDGSEVLRVPAGLKLNGLLIDDTRRERMAVRVAGTWVVSTDDGVHKFPDAQAALDWLAEEGSS